MDKDKISKLIRKTQARDTLKQTFDLTVDARVERWIDIKPHEIIPNSHFAAVSMESYELYRDGYFYGAISLSQSVAEALVRFICEKNGERFSSYENALQILKRKGIINDQLLDLFTTIRKARNDYHHLNSDIETERQALGGLAKEKLQALQVIEAEIFAYTTNEGKIRPAYPQYWDVNTEGGTIQVYLRID
jgi:uncharacterized protein YutE (UPF0331/DUF86 family)